MPTFDDNWNYQYNRTGNPTRAAIETSLAVLEGAGMQRPVYGLAFSSGMAVIDNILRLLQPGDHVLAGDDVYGGTYRLFEQVVKGYGIDFSYVEVPASLVRLSVGIEQVDDLLADLEQALAQA